MTDSTKIILAFLRDTLFNDPYITKKYAGKIQALKRQLTQPPKTNLSKVHSLPSIPVEVPRISPKTTKNNNKNTPLLSAADKQNNNPIVRLPNSPIVVVPSSPIVCANKQPIVHVPSSPIVCANKQTTGRAPAHDSPNSPHSNANPAAPTPADVEMVDLDTVSSASESDDLPSDTNASSSSSDDYIVVGKGKKRARKAKSSSQTNPPKKVASLPAATKAMSPPEVSRPSEP